MKKIFEDKLNGLTIKKDKFYYAEQSILNLHLLKNVFEKLNIEVTKIFCDKFSDQTKQYLDSLYIDDFTNFRVYNINYYVCQIAEIEIVMDTIEKIETPAYGDKQTFLNNMNKQIRYLNIIISEITKYNNKEETEKEEKLREHVQSELLKLKS